MCAGSARPFPGLIPSCVTVPSNGSLISVHFLSHRSACHQPMEDSMDMDMSPLRPQNYLFEEVLPLREPKWLNEGCTCCELKADKDYHFKVDNDENEHQLSLRTVSLGAGAKDELHIVEAEAMNYEGSPIKVTLATLKMSVQPTVSLGGFEITPPVVLRLKCGSGPVHISGQHLVAVEEDAESEDEEEEDVKLLSISGKRSAPGSGSKVPQKKVKLAADEDEDDDDDDDDEDEDDDDDDFDDEEAEEKAPVKKSVRDTPAKNAQKSNQNGKDSKPSTPRSKGQESFKKQEKTPKTPKGPSSVEDIKAKMQASIEKGGSLPKVEAKFINYVKNCFRMTDQEAIQDLWQWRKSL
ncbi:nucleophosmin isoform X1 [Kogia breviceps]|uniref:nucleophosmin isoform X1 n=2 Tax=Kogia breviceps TaxID=27615 RepID=UPI0034D155CC